MALNRNQAIKNAHTWSDRMAEAIVNFAGSMSFLLVHVLIFTAWLLINSGTFGHNLIFDKFPFSFLTTAVSLEAIVLSVFVLMSERRQSKVTELRTELDYKADLQSEIDVKTIVSILERMAKERAIDITDLLADMKANEHKANQTKTLE